MAYKVNIALIGNPKIWRAIIIPESYTFSDLHISIQDAMGWSNAHLYEFKLFNPVKKKNSTIGIPDEYFEPSEIFMDSRKTRLSEIFSGRSLNATYI